MSRRLPIAGAAPRPAAVDEPVDRVPKDERAHLPLPTLALVDATLGAGAEPLGKAIVEELRARGVKVRLLPAAELEERGVEACFGDLEGVEVVVTLGAGLPCTHAPRLTLVLTGGRLPIAWSAAARALRDRLDGELGAYRPAFARALAEEWAGITNRDVSALP